MTIRKPTNNIIVESWLKRELLATLAIYYEKQSVLFRNLPELIRQALEDFEHMIASSGEGRIVDPLEASNVLQRLGLRGHKEKKSGAAYLNALQFQTLARKSTCTADDAMREIEKAAEFDEEEATKKSQQRDQKEKEALAQGPGESTIIKEK